MRWCGLIHASETAWKGAEADAFRTLCLNRREALCAVHGLADRRLPLFAAEQDG
jgi:hypothetical protein